MNLRPERAPQVPRLHDRRGQGAQYETKLPYREAPACGGELHIGVDIIPSIEENHGKDFSFTKHKWTS